MLDTKEHYKSASQCHEAQKIYGLVSKLLSLWYEFCSCFDCFYHRHEHRSKPFIYFFRFFFSFYRFSFTIFNFSNIVSRRWCCALLCAQFNDDQTRNGNIIIEKLPIYQRCSCHGNFALRKLNHTLVQSLLPISHFCVGFFGLTLSLLCHCLHLFYCRK